MAMNEGRQKAARDAARRQNRKNHPEKYEKLDALEREFEISEALAEPKKKRPTDDKEKLIADMIETDRAGEIAEDAAKGAAKGATKGALSMLGGERGKKDRAPTGFGRGFKKGWDSYK